MHDYYLAFARNVRRSRTANTNFAAKVLLFFDICKKNLFFLQIATERHKKSQHQPALSVYSTSIELSSLMRVTAAKAWYVIPWSRRN